jgi:L-ribulose-5-phosphate 3-epimerase UlaE
MKLLFVTCIKEHQKVVADIFSQSKINVFSVSETHGYKDQPEGNLQDAWFGKGAAPFESLVVFSFTDAEKASLAISLIENYNRKDAEGFPIRAFQLAVERTSRV